MLKILLAINPFHPGRHVIDLAAYMARFTGSSLTGVFLENSSVLSNADAPTVLQRVKTGGLPGTADVLLTRNDLVEKSIADFCNACFARDVHPRIHRDRQIPSTELVNETRFADMLVMDPTISFLPGQEGSLSNMVIKVLLNTECPVLLSSGSTQQIDEIILAYDGEQDCMHSIKQFVYLFPECRSKKITVLVFHSLAAEKGKDFHRFKEWLHEHFTNVQFEFLLDQTVMRLPASILAKENLLIVMGSYGRNAVSRFFRQSHADIILRTVSHPVFIAHT